VEPANYASAREFPDFIIDLLVFFIIIVIIIIVVFPVIVLTRVHVGPTYVWGSDAHDLQLDPTLSAIETLAHETLAQLEFHIATWTTHLRHLSSSFGLVGLAGN
jgi:hypothetical protein